MSKVISIYLLLLFSCLNSHAQQGTFGYRISGDGDIVSDVFKVQDGYVLDSVYTGVGNLTYQFEYDEKGRLKRDINFYRVATTIPGPRPIIILVPGSRDYYYNDKGYIDSVGYGRWIDGLWVSDSMGYKYHYSKKGKLISIVYSQNDMIYEVEENEYDYDDRLIKSADIDYPTGDTLEVSYRKYDQQNRLQFIKNVKFSRESHYVYKYDSSNNVNITFFSFHDGETTNSWNWYLEFDEFNKIVYEVYSRVYSPEDSTWLENHEIPFTYDENGRLVEMGSYWCDYYGNGNVHSLFNPHPVDNGYLGFSATLVDSYGNRISIPEADDCKFYYSKIVVNIDEDKPVKMDFRLYQNYPNPFNPATKISFEIAKPAVVTVDILNTVGQKIETVANRRFNAGLHTINFDASGLASGLYFYKIQTGSFSDIKKMILIR